MPVTKRYNVFITPEVAQLGPT